MSCALFYSCGQLKAVLQRNQLSLTSCSSGVNAISGTAVLDPRRFTVSGEVGVESSSTGSSFIAAGEIVSSGRVPVTGEMGHSEESVMIATSREYLCARQV